MWRQIQDKDDPKFKPCKSPTADVLTESEAVFLSVNVKMV